MTRADTHSILKYPKLVQKIEDKYPVHFIYLFGSAARDTLHKNSDVDIAVHFEKKPDGFAIVELREDLSDIAKRPVDLIPLNDVSPILAMQVFKYGKALLIRDKRKWSDYFMWLTTAYNDLKIVRRPIEANILRGRIFD